MVASGASTATLKYGPIIIPGGRYGSPGGSSAGERNLHSCPDHTSIFRHAYAQYVKYMGNSLQDSIFVA